MRRVVWLVLTTLGFVAALFVFVFPTRTYLAQRATLHQVTAELARLEQEDRALSQQAARLQSPSEIARLARRDYGLVRPGQQAYVILPPPLGRRAAR
jgi:cell division protein FtsB